MLGLSFLVLSGFIKGHFSFFFFTGGLEPQYLILGPTLVFLPLASCCSVRVVGRLYIISFCFYAKTPFVLLIKRVIGA